MSKRFPDVRIATLLELIAKRLDRLGLSDHDFESVGVGDWDRPLVILRDELNDLAGDIKAEDPSYDEDEDDDDDDSSHIESDRSVREHERRQMGIAP